MQERAGEEREKIKVIIINSLFLKLTNNDFVRWLQSQVLTLIKWQVIGTTNAKMPVRPHDRALLSSTII
jgi:hypothetical protein